MPRRGTRRSMLGRFSAAALMFLGTAAPADDRSTTIELTVEAGAFDREQTPMQISIPTADLDGDWGDRLEAIADENGRLLLREAGRDGPAIPAQVDRSDEQPGRVRILWVLDRPIPAGTRSTFRAESLDEPEMVTPWSFRRNPEGHLELSLRDDPVFRYNTSPVRHPDHPDPKQARDAYIHPAFAPSGAVVTGDYSADSHPHHRGFFLAYTKTKVGDLEPDFWNIQGGSGKVQFERLDRETVGPVSARFSAFHRWEASRPDGDPVVVLRERWDVEAFDIPGSPYRLIDLTSTQQAEGEPMVLPPYRYGGMAYRGPDSFVPDGVLDVLTSEGFDRARGDQKPARWVDLTGPVAEGSETYAGAAIFDHPSNVNHPTPARIHPTRLPFFCFVPGHDSSVTIGSEAPTVFRFRILIHDGHPDATVNERLWHDFADPPEVNAAIRPS